MESEEGLSRRMREKMAHRQEILEAAKRVFARKGFHAATVDEIAQEADFSKGAVYVHFATKEELFLSLIEEKTKKLGQRLEEIVNSSDDLETKLRKFVEAHLDAFNEDKEFFQLITAEHPRLTAETHDRLHLRLKERYLKTLRTVDKMMKQGIQQGKLKNVDPQFLSITLLGIIHSFTAQWLLLGRKDSLPRQKSLILELFLQGARL